MANAFSNKDLIEILENIDLGSDIAETDDLLESTKIETSVFSDLLNDRVDLIPGTKGSGKSALYRIFVEFLAKILFKQNKVVIAHGVNQTGDSVFHAYKNQFEKLSEEEFINFWCIYLVSLANKHFLQNQIYAEKLKDCVKEIENFKTACEKAYVPEIKKSLSLNEVLGWVLNAIRKLKPKATYKFPEGGEVEVNLFGEPIESKKEKNESLLPQYGAEIKESLEKILEKSNLNLWLMIDRLDEIFPRRSDLERKALRALLKTMRFFSASRIRIKIFLRDDILDSIVLGGFTALSHITSKQADTLRWEKNQLRDLILNRLLSNEKLRDYLSVDMDRIKASAEYRNEIFNEIFPKTVHRGKKQSDTMTWIFKRTADGNGVVTPRDVIHLLIKARQRQLDILSSDVEGKSENIISSQAIIYGHLELSKHKRKTLLEAEFPHLWQHIKKFIGGKTQYDDESLKKMFNSNWEKIISDLVSIGVVSKRMKQKKIIYEIPFLYREALEVKQGKA